MNLERDIRAHLPRAAEMMAGLSADQINWRPAENSWSIAECIAHLNKFNELYTGSIDAAIAQARLRGRTSNTAVQPKLGLLEAWVVRLIEPPCRLKLKAPSTFRPEGSTFTRDDLLAAWTSTHERLAHLARTSDGLDLKRVKVTSPATPLLKVSLLAALMITSAHDRRHLWQAERVRDRLLQSVTRSAE